MITSGGTTTLGLYDNASAISKKADIEYVDETVGNLQGLLNSVGTGNRAYKTYAEMDADKANIPAKSKVTVTNDTTASNNGDWQWDGAVFTKSAYDPVETLRSWSNSNALFKAKPILNNDDLNDYRTEGFYYISSTSSTQTIANVPELIQGALSVVRINQADRTTVKQIYYAGSNIEYQRTYRTNVWSKWERISNTTNFTLDIPISSNLNDLKTNGFYQVKSIRDSATIENIPEVTTGLCLVYQNGLTDFSQTFYTSTGKQYYRTFNDGVWTNWSQIVSNNFAKKVLGIENPATPVSFCVGNFNATTMKMEIPVESTIRSAIIKVKPNTKYTLAKELSDRFAIAEFGVLPVHDAPVLNVIKAASTVSNLDTFTTDGQIVESVTFTTGSSSQYLVVYVSRYLSEEPKVSLMEGDLDLSKIDFTKVIATKPVIAPNIVRGKNLYNTKTMLRSGKLINLRAETGELYYETGGVITNKYYAVVVPISGGKTYSISKLPSSRFRVGTSTLSESRFTSSVKLTPVFDDATGTKCTFTAEAGAKTLVIYIGFNEPPPFLQVEEAEAPTDFETFGFKMTPVAKKIHELAIPDAIGDAYYLSKATAGAWANGSYTIPANDDTAALQDAFDNARGTIQLEAHKVYRITSSLVVDIAKAKFIAGNMATIVVDGDFEGIIWKGSLTQSANAEALDRKIARNEMNPILCALRITNPMEVLGTGLVIDGCMSPCLLACNINYMKRGIAFRNINRNVILNASSIYACHEYGIHFERTCNLHQINITGCHISYCDKNIYGDNADIFNIQITGSDIETSSYPAGATCNIHFDQSETGVLEDLELVGNTIEDHYLTNSMVILNGGTNASRISCVTIAGNVTGNSGGTIIQIGGAFGIDISGQFKNSAGHAIEVIGNLDGAKISIQVRQGGLFKAVGNIAMRDVNVNGCSLSGTVSKNPILIDATDLNNCSFSHNTLRVTNTNDFDAVLKAPVTVKSKTMTLVRVDGNNIASSNLLEKAVEIIATTSSTKGSMCGNMATSGTYSAPASFITANNS